LRTRQANAQSKEQTTINSAEQKRRTLGLNSDPNKKDEILPRLINTQVDLLPKEKLSWQSDERKI
jgi:hypothetical protein